MHQISPMCPYHGYMLKHMWKPPRIPRRSVRYSSPTLRGGAWIYAYAVSRGTARLPYEVRPIVARARKQVLR